MPDQHKVIKDLMVKLFVPFESLLEIKQNSARSKNKDVIFVSWLNFEFQAVQVTEEKLQQYAGYFHPNFTGITGTLEQLQKVARQYGTYFTKVAGSSELNYLIDHTSATFIIGKDGKFAASKSHGSTAEQIVEGIRSAL